MSDTINTLKKRVPVLYLLVADFIISNILYLLFVDKISYNTSSKFVSTSTIILCIVAMLWDWKFGNLEDEEVSVLSKIYKIAFIICIPMNLIVSSIEYCGEEIRKLFN